MREVFPVTLREFYACIGERHAIGPTRSLTELGYQIIPCIGTSRSITEVNPSRGLDDFLHTG